MSGKIGSVPKKKTAFDAWGMALPLRIRESKDVDFARRCFQAGHVVGTRPVKVKYKFRVGRLKVSVWATSIKEAMKEAEVELDYHIAKAGKRPPAAGWRLIPVTEDA
jgi:hypothetical protein